MPTAHTPGPWRIATKDTNRRVVDAAGHSTCVASPLTRGREDEAKANAVLVAAAPDMLAALQRIKAECVQAEKCGWSAPSGAWLDVIASAAIARAEGRS